MFAYVVDFLFATSHIFATTSHIFATTSHQGKLHDLSLLMCNLTQWSGLTYDYLHDNNSIKEYYYALLQQFMTIHFTVHVVIFYLWSEFIANITALYNIVNHISTKVAYFIERGLQNPNLSVLVMACSMCNSLTK